jgi:hypothetical protein
MVLVLRTMREKVAANLLAKVLCTVCLCPVVIRANWFPKPQLE